MSASFRILFFGVLALIVGLGVAQAQVALDLKDPQPGATATGRAQEGGPVETWHVQIGDEVKAGQLVVSLEHARQLHAFETAKLKAKNTAPLESAQGELKKKEAALEEGQTRLRRRQISEEQFRMLEGDAEVSRAAIKQARLNKKMAQLDADLAEKLLERRFIRSPIDGTVVAITRQPGEQAGTGEAVVTVADFSTLAVEIPLTGQSLATLEAGDNFVVQTSGGGQRLARVLSVQSLPDGSARDRLVKLGFPPAPSGPSGLSESYRLLLPEGIEEAPPAPPAPKAEKKS